MHSHDSEHQQLSGFIMIWFSFVLETLQWSIVPRRRKPLPVYFLRTFGGCNR